MKLNCQINLFGHLQELLFMILLILIKFSLPQFSYVVSVQKEACSSPFYYNGCSNLLSTIKLKLLSAAK